MINLNIQDGVLLNAPDNIIFINKNNNYIQVKSNSNSSKTIYLVITGFLKDYYVPLYFQQKDTDANIFENQIQFKQENITYIKKYPNKIYNCYFKIDDIIIDGTFKINIMLSDIVINEQQDIIIDLQNKYNDLQATLKNFMLTYPTINVTDAVLQKGAVPVATGYGNTYVWDYPKLIIKDLTDKVKKLSEIVVDLSEQNKHLTTKISELETKINNHVNEQYML